MPAPRTFSRSERLKSAKVIASLFKGGQSLMAYPLRVVWVVHENPAPEVAQIAISVSKRLFKTAVQRNRIKRQIREAYRLNKDAFYRKLEEKKLHISLMVIYIAKEPLPYSEIDAGVKKMIRKFE